MPPLKCIIAGAMPGIRRLVDYPWVLVRVRCDVCKRAGAYRLARLAVKFGAEILLDDLIVRLSSDCPWRDEPRGSCATAVPSLTQPDSVSTAPEKRIRLAQGGYCAAFAKANHCPARWDFRNKTCVCM
jgi:hypothetical protein